MFYKKFHNEVQLDEYIGAFSQVQLTGLPGLALKNKGEKIPKSFQKCRRNIG